jgi:serine/threonine protein kinase
MASGKECPQCGAPLAAGALEGLCPACLLKQGAETGTQGESTPFQAPTVEELRGLFPQFEILAFLEKGGMGAVYKARQAALDRVVALKVLPLQGPRGPQFAERFHREARALARLNHPNIVAVHEFGQVDGFAFFVMEFVDGLTLREVQRAGQLSPREALKIVPQICEALQFAHDEGIVHRDIKPENILLDKKGRVKIADFGIAKIMGREPGAAITETKHAIGTPHYMAPEQVEKPETVDHRADIFSLGVVFYEMLTGELPLGKFPPPSRKVEVDVRLDEVVLRALEKEPERRYQHASQIKTDVETVARVPHALPHAVRGGKFAYLALGLILTAVGVAILFLRRSADMAPTQYLNGVDSHPPVVVMTEPVSGSRDVEPGIREIRVRFSKAMTPGSWSWSTAWSNSAPEIVRGAWYEPDQRTCVIAARPEPGRTYAYWLNSDQFQNFKDTQGRPAVPYLLIFETKQKE